jgi:hypothetical protein
VKIIGARIGNLISDSRYEAKILITTPRPRYIWEDNIKRDITDTEYVSMLWFHKRRAISGPPELLAC